MSLNLDTTHSSVEFSVRHMGLATVRGRFEKFSVDAEANEQGEPTRVSAVIDAASINTGTSPLVAAGVSGGAIAVPFNPMSPAFSPCSVMPGTCWQ